MSTDPTNRAAASPDGVRNLSLRVAAGDEVVTRITAFAAENSVEHGFLVAIGGFDEFTLARYDMPSERFVELQVPHEHVEVLNVTGQVALDAEPRVHLHAVLAGPDGNAFGGHLVRAVAQPMLLVSLTERRPS
ncbi:PPC domain-containing DNA-binding protein [Actinomadura latina]|uniref:DNA-binding protein n=1 Tax=Actinomadura latina TaxID=163603 RepID=A0A846Z1A1_9ACTN|nr:PPC domain-containing DNA-binding protein [Actinomadura latina]NKZ07050.1 DNA-binding protein [Actinomadura latina]